MGLLSSSKSKSSSLSTTENQDKRVVADGGSGVNSFDRSKVADAGATILDLSGAYAYKGTNNTSVTVTDGGAVRAALDFAGRTVDAVAGDGFERLLSVAADLFKGQQEAQAEQLAGIAAAYGDASGMVSQAYAQADSDKAGAIDNRTMIVLAVVAGVAFIMFRKG